MNDNSASPISHSGPKGKLITGNLREFKSDTVGFLSRMAKEYGEVARFRLGPFQRNYLITNPDLIKEILVTKSKYFVKSQEFSALKPMIGEGIFTSEKPLHTQQRKLIQPAFKRANIDNYALDMIDITTDFASTWQDGEERIATRDMMDITLNIINKTMFSMDFKDGHHLIGKPLDVSMQMAVKRMRFVLRLPLWVPTKHNREYKKAVQSLDQVVYDIIEKRRSDEAVHEDMLGILMDARDENDGSGMSYNQIRDEVMTIFVAGHETTSTALSWAFYLLSQHPEVEKKLHEELDSAIGSRMPVPGDFKKLTYTQNIVWEALRLYPPAFIYGRRAIEDVEIGGYPFKKGDTLMLSQYLMHRSEKYFDNPDSFIPERFENNFMKTLPLFAFFPFGGGPRVCIGNHFAMMEAVFVIACIAKRYRLRLAPDHHEVKMLPHLTLRPRRGLRMIVEERKNI
ncbi:cytochrome P450 [Metabacillus sp. RGM 3146]|uniref:cytochrome P450 n=1 Tax=Metabacillus sp. RGM 3146 TaxID=3401092 RepID=UPI003B9AA9D2